MKGYRPSYFQSHGELDDLLERDKQTNLQRYIQRVEERLPLFDRDSDLQSRLLGGEKSIPA